MAYILPAIGEMWLDQDGHHNLVLDREEDAGEYFFTLLTLDTGDIWDWEHENGWNVHYRSSYEPFYCKRL